MVNPKGLFELNAPKYWKCHLPVIPLLPRAKGTHLRGWQEFSFRKQTAKEQAHFLLANKNGNLGLVLGQVAKIVIVDVDTNDPEAIKAIESVLPPTPWKRVGKKGYCAAYKYSGEKSFQVRNSDNETFVELLSDRKQMVLPPSIHPDTRKPYVANCFLGDVLDDLVVLPSGFEEVLRNAIELHTDIELSITGSTRITDFVSTGSRDNQMTAVAGMFAYGITKGELTLKEAIGRMIAWHSTSSEKIAGDDVDITKGISKVVEFLTKDVLGPKNKPLPIGWDEGLTPQEKLDLNVLFDEDVEEWNYKKCVDYLTIVFKKHSDKSDPERVNAVEHVLLKISRSPTLSGIDQERVLKWINQVNKDISISSLKKQLLSLKSGKIGGLDHSELAVGTIEDLERNGDLRFYQDKFWQWKGSHWEKIEDTFILKHISMEYGKLPAARRQNDHTSILRVMKTLVPQELVDTKVHGINFANGFLLVDKLSKKIRLAKHHPQYGMVYTLPFRYLPAVLEKQGSKPTVEELLDPNSSYGTENGEDEGKSLDCPKFKAFLKSIWGKDEDYEQKVKLLRQMMGITIFGMGPSFERAVLLFGLPHSGKTQLMRIMKDLMPDNVCSHVSPYQFSDKFEVSQLSTSYLNLCGELNIDKSIEGARFKSIIGGEIMLGQYKNKQVFNFAPQCTHWFASNHLPKTKDMSDGFNRRWAILTFNMQVSKKDKVRDIGQTIILEEREQIVSWVVDEMRELINEPDVTLPESHKATLQEMASSNDSVFFWMMVGGVEVKTIPNHLKNTPSLISSERLGVVNKKELLPAAQLYEDYWAFCSNQGGVRPTGLRMFCSRMREIAALKHFKMITNKASPDITCSSFYGLKLGGK